ncbi:TniB family NTP-binding protein [Kitasatospora sp. NPDC058478]|uniref:TniB family NTP-binding protein n=1 Tax=unclassified Kitasatospora TaxID=2633591 RepID=UPI003668E71E
MTIHPGLSEPRTKEEWRAYLEAEPPARPSMPRLTEYLSWSDEQRADFDHAREEYHSALIILKTAPMQRINRQITRKLKLNTKAQAGARPGIVIDGPPTVGKSTLVKTFAADFEQSLRTKHPERFSEERLDDYIPVVYVSVPAGATPKMLSAAIAHYLCLELPRGATISDISTRVLEALRRCGTELIIIDDIHFLDVSVKEGRLANDHLKHLANFAAATFVYTGVEVEKSGLFLEGGHSERATQTSGRFTLFELERFSIDTPDQAREWAEVIKGMESALALFKHKNGTLVREWEYLHARTNGSISSLSILIREAALEAADTGTEKITKALMDRIVLPRAAEQSYRDAKRKRRPRTQPPAPETGGDKPGDEDGGTVPAAV